MKASIYLFLFLGLFGCENESKPLWLSGTWNGTFKDTHTSNDPKISLVDQPAYPAELKYKVSTNSGIVSYPTLGCTSQWIYLKTDNDTLFFEEKIVSDANQIGCVDRMQYKIMQISKNEIAISGTGVTRSGFFCETRGVFTKGGKTVSESLKNSNTEPELQKVQSNQVVSNNKSQIANPKPDDCQICGTWETVIYWNSGGKTRNIWDVKSNGKVNMRTIGSNGYDKTLNLKWRMSGTNFYEINSEGESLYEINWISQDAFIVRCEGSLDNQRYDRIKVIPPPPPPPPPGEECSIPCPACNSTGKVPCNSMNTTPEDLRCVTPQRFSDCMTNPDPGSRFYVCCRCFGTGTYKYKCR